MPQARRFFGRHAGKGPFPGSSWDQFHAMPGGGLGLAARGRGGRAAAAGCVNPGAGLVPGTSASWGGGARLGSRGDIEDGVPCPAYRSCGSQGELKCSGRGGRLSLGAGRVAAARACLGGRRHGSITGQTATGGGAKISPTGPFAARLLPKADGHGPARVVTFVHRGVQQGTWIFFIRWGHRGLAFPGRDPRDGGRA